MTKDTALKMAIDCLEYHYKNGAWGMDIEGVIVFCQEALATNKKSSLVQLEQEPVAYINVTDRTLEWALPTKFNTASVGVYPRLPLYLSPAQSMKGKSNES